MLRGEFRSVAYGVVWCFALLFFAPVEIGRLKKRPGLGGPERSFFFVSWVTRDLCLCVCEVCVLLWLFVGVFACVLFCV